MALPKKKTYPRIVSTLIDTFGLNPVAATVLVLLMTAVAVAAIFWFIRSAPW